VYTPFLYCSPGLNYYFVVEMQTNPNESNLNTVYSGFSGEVALEHEADSDDDGLPDSLEASYVHESKRCGQ
jgi:hypothetical protein